MILYYFKRYYSAEDVESTVGGSTSKPKPETTPKNDKPAYDADSTVGPEVTNNPREWNVKYEGKAVNESTVINPGIESLIKKMSEHAGIGQDGVQGYDVNLKGQNDPFSIYQKDAEGNWVYHADAGPDWIGERKFNQGHYSMEGFLNSIGLTNDRLHSRILNVDSINANKLMNPVDYVNFGRGYIFFTKPDLMLYTLNNQGVYDINPSIAINMPDLYVKIKKNPLIARALQSSLAYSPVTRSDYGFIHLLGNMCASAPAPEMSLGKLEGTKNMKDYGINYGSDYLLSIGNTDISLEFYDNRYRDVTTMLEIWTEYIEGLSQGKIYKKKGYRDGNIIDYAISIYIFTVDETNNIMGHSSYIGCYPKSIPTSVTNYKRESYTADHFIGPFATNWQVSMGTRPNAHSTIEAFNYASGYKRVLAFMEKDTHYGMSWPMTFKGGFKANKVGEWSATGGKVDTEYIMHKSIEAWGLDIIRDTSEDANILKGYRHQLTLTEYWPQYAGVTLTNSSGGLQQYALIFFSTKEYLNRIKFKVRGPYDYDDLIDYKHYDRVNYGKLGLTASDLDKNGNPTDAAKQKLSDENIDNKNARMNMAHDSFYYWMRKMELIYTMNLPTYKEPKIKGRVATIDYGHLYQKDPKGFIPKLENDNTKSELFGTGGGDSSSGSKPAGVNYRDLGSLGGK